MHIDNPEWEAWATPLKAAAPELLLRIVKRDTKKIKHEHGGQILCCSPLRVDKNPSFSVYPDGGWHDWGRQEHGDLISYIQIRDGLTGSPTKFKDALNVIAKELGQKTWEETRPNGGGNGALAKATADELLEMWKNEGERRLVHEIISILVHECHRQLPDRVRTYLNDHYGLSDEFIDLEKIGWVSAGLYAWAEESLPQYTEEMLLKSGFFIKRQNEVLVANSFRILFPYWRRGFCEYAIYREHNFGLPKNQLNIAPWDEGKYTKHRTYKATRPYISPFIENVFWGEDSLKNASKEKWLIIAEGITDAMMLNHLGFDVISPVTTRPSRPQLERLITMAKAWKGVLIVNDNEANRSGEKGAIRTALALWRAAIPVKIGTLPLPPEATKIDVNEFCVAELQKRKHLSRHEADIEVAHKVQEVFDHALVLPEFLVRVDLTSDLSLTEIEQKLQELGTVCQSMTPLQRGDVWAKIERKVPKLPKRAGRKVFETAIAVEDARVRAGKEAKALDEAQDDAGHARAAGKLDAIPKLRCIIHEDIGYYEKRLPNGESERLSTFSLILLRTIAKEGEPDWLVTKVITLGGDVLFNEWIISPKSWGSKRSFIGAFPSVRMQWLGNDDEVQSLYEYMTRGGVSHVPHVRGTEVLGHHTILSPLKTPLERFVLPGGVIDKSGTWMTEPDMSYLPIGGSNLQFRLPKEASPFNSEENRVLAKHALEQVYFLHAPEVIAPMVWWFASCPFRTKLKEAFGGFPLLNIYGTHGSGKSSIVSLILWPMFAGVQQSAPLSCTSTPFGLTKDIASTNAIPIAFDEYKPADMGKYVEWFRRVLRRVYSGETETRGRSDQSISAYILNAPIVVMGESKIEDDPALTERMIFVSPNKNWLTKHPLAQEQFHDLKSMPLWKIAPLYQAWSMTVDIGPLLKEAKIRLHTAQSKLGIQVMPTRVSVNITCAIFGMVSLEAFAKTLDAELLSLDTNTIIARLIGEIIDIEAGFGGTVGTNVRDAFDDFLIDASTLAHAGRIKEGVHYLWQGDKVLFLYIKLIEAERSRWRKEQGLPVTSPGVRALIRIIDEKIERPEGTYIKRRQRMDLNDGYVNGIIIDPTQVPDAFGVDGFPRNEMSGRPFMGPRLLPWGTEPPKSNKPD